MKRINSDEEVILSIVLTQRIHFLTEQMATSSEEFKWRYKKEIEQTQDLLKLIYNSKLFALIDRDIYTE